MKTSMKFFLLLLLSYSIPTFANYKDCTKEDMCLHTPCSTFIMEQIQGEVITSTCFQVYKKNKETGDHHLAYREVKILTKSTEGKEVATTIRLVDFTGSKDIIKSKK